MSDTQVWGRRGTAGGEQGSPRNDVAGTDFLDVWIIALVPGYCVSLGSPLPAGKGSRLHII